MLLAFQKRFIPYVLDGSKRHTIRAGERWKAGMRADLYEESRRPKKYDASGAQVSGMRLLFRDLVTKVDPILIEHSGRAGFQLVENTSIFIAGNELKDFERDLFAWTDGFREDCNVNQPYGVVGAFEQMVAFWEAEHKFGRKIHKFGGQIMHWDYEQRFMEMPGKAKQKPYSGRAVRQLERFLSLRGGR